MMKALARSLAGHDKGHYYVVLSERDGFVWLADGKQRTVLRPKKKNRRHIQIIKNLPEEVTVLLDGEHPDDVAVKRALKLFLKHEKE